MAICQIVFVDSHYLSAILTAQLNSVIYIQVMLKLSNHHAIVKSGQQS